MNLASSIGTVLTVMLAATFLVASVAKLTSLSDWKASLGKAKMPRWMLIASSFGVPIAEIIIGILMLIPATTMFATIAGIGLLVVFTILVRRIAALQQGCGCFGRFFDSQSIKVLTTRNVALMAVGLGALTLALAG